jgi:NAD(P)-dependent dehydrogenase (short-subunit alcohol dehydrogenase family)
LLAPINLYMRSQFLTARAAVNRMSKAGSGAILMNTPEPARLGVARVGGMGPAWAAMEALSRNLSAEFGPNGVRSVVLRSTGMPETQTIDIVYGLHAKAPGITPQQFQAFAEGLTHRKRSTSVAEVAEFAAFLASDKASAMTGTVANLTGPDRRLTLAPGRHSNSANDACHWPIRRSVRQVPRPKTVARWYRSGAADLRRLTVCC